MTIRPWLTEMAEGKIPNAFEIAKLKFDSELKTGKYATLNENGGVMTKPHHFKMAIAQKREAEIKIIYFFKSVYLPIIYLVFFPI